MTTRVLNEELSITNGFRTLSPSEWASVESSIPPYSASVLGRISPGFRMSCNPLCCRARTNKAVRRRALGSTRISSITQAMSPEMELASRRVMVSQCRSKKIQVETT